MHPLLLIFAQLTITASAPDTIVAGESAVLSIEVTGPGDRNPSIARPRASPFILEGRAVTSRIDRSNWTGPWVTMQVRYTLRTDRLGTFTIPPIEARLGSQWARSRPLRIVVRAPGAAPRAVPEILARAQLDTTAPVHFRVLVLPDTVYVGEQAVYQVGLFVESGARSRLRRNPEFIAPEMRALLTYDLPLARGRFPSRIVDGRRYEAHVYERAVFPVQAGRHIIPPARLVYSLPASASFFSREETHELYSDSVTLVVREPPVDTRPADFTGVVGEVRLSARLDTASARVGDPMLLTMRVAGEGNVKFFPRPGVVVPWGDLVEANERVELDSAASVVRGYKEFDWVLTPREEGRVALPAVRYPYFSPDSNAYLIAITTPETLFVRTGSLAATESAGASAAPPLPVRRVYRGAAAIPLTDFPAYWFALLFAPLPALALRFASRPARPRPRSAARILDELAATARGRDPRALRRAYVAALAERLALPAVAFGRRGATARALRRAGVSAPVAQRAEEMLDELDAAAYAPRGRLPADAARRARAIAQEVHREARDRIVLRAAAPLVLLLFVAGGATLLAAPLPFAPAQRFADGVALYEARQYAGSAAAFAQITEHVPDAPDAWANYGTASWARGDTAGAVLGWQRAMRLEPAAGDVRHRLSLVRGHRVGATAWVPRLPANAPAIAGGVLWIVAWVLAAARARRAPRWTREWAVSAGLMAIMILAAGRELEQRLDARDLAVVRGPAPLRTLPTLAGDRGTSAHTGEVVRITERRAGWARVALDDRRVGWVESTRLASLARRR